MQDNFNLAGLHNSVPEYDNALRLICDYETGARWAGARGGRQPTH